MVDDQWWLFDSVLFLVMVGVIGLDVVGEIDFLNCLVLWFLGIELVQVYDWLLFEVVFEFVLFFDKLGQFVNEFVQDEICLNCDGCIESLLVCMVIWCGVVGGLEGYVVVLDDVMDLVLVQCMVVWGDVVCCVVYEIKNLLMLIQLFVECLCCKFSFIVGDECDMLE